MIKKGEKMGNLKVNDVYKKAKLSFNKKKAEKAQKLIEKKLLQLDEAEKAVRKIKNQIQKLKNMDLSDIELVGDNY